MDSAIKVDSGCSRSHAHTVPILDATVAVLVLSLGCALARLRLSPDNDSKYYILHSRNKVSDARSLPYVQTKGRTEIFPSTYQLEPVQAFDVKGSPHHSPHARKVLKVVCFGNIECHSDH